MVRHKKLEKVKFDKSKLKSLSFTPGRKSQLGINKPRKLRPDQIVSKTGTRGQL